MDRQTNYDIGNREFKKGKKDRFKYLFELCVGLVGLSVAVAVGIAGWQAYTWSQTGTWPSIRMFDLLAFLGADLQGIYYPEREQDLNRYAQFVLQLPAALVLPLVTFILAAFVSLFTRSGKS